MEKCFKKLHNLLAVRSYCGCAACLMTHSLEPARAYSTPGFMHLVRKNKHLRKLCCLLYKQELNCSPRSERIYVTMFATLWRAPSVYDLAADHSARNFQLECRAAANHCHDKNKTCVFDCVCVVRRLHLRPYSPQFLFPNVWANHTKFTGYRVTFLVMRF
jgi:hypothetical protein